MDWTMVGAVATTLYTISFVVALWIAYVQLDRFEKSRKLQVVLTIFKELESQELITARIYIYKSLPENIEGLSKEQIENHFREASPAIFSLDRIGYLIQKSHVDKGEFIERYWSTIWRCWKKSKNFIAWSREQRGEPDFYQTFDYLFNLAEAYRIQKDYKESQSSSKPFVKGVM